MNGGDSALTTLQEENLPDREISTPHDVEGFEPLLHVDKTGQVRVQFT